MKILVISHMYPSSVNKISGIFVHQQVKELIELGHQVKVISPKPMVPFPLTLISKRWKKYSIIPAKTVIDGVEVYNPRYLEFPRSFFMEYSGYLMFMGMKQTVREIYQEFPFDLIHAHVALPDGFAATKFKSIYLKPIVVTIHGQDLQYTIFRGEKSKKRLRYVFQSSEKIVTVSNKLKKIAEENFPGLNNVAVVHNGINSEEILLNKRKDRDKDEIRILSVSNLVPTKGIDLNIIALSNIIKEHPNIHYTIVGDGSERMRLEAIVEQLNLGQYITFLGKLDHRQAMEEMTKADIFSLPSWKEGFGMVYLEAMAHGLPVVGCEGEGISDIVINGENGFLVKPKDIDDLSKTLTFLIREKKKRIEIGEKSQYLVLNNYTWSQQVAKLIEIYKEVKQDV